MLFDINELKWDEVLCKKLGIPMSMLPEPVPSSMIYGKVAPGITGLEALVGVPVCGSAGDQAAALIGQGCVKKGQAKNTYGTGCFTLLNTGDQSVRSVNGLVTSVAWSIDGKTLTPLRAACLTQAALFSGCATRSAFLRQAPNARLLRPPFRITAEYTSFRHSRVSAHRAGICTRAEQLSAYARLHEGTHRPCRAGGHCISGKGSARRYGGRRRRAAFRIAC